MTVLRAARETDLPSLAALERAIFSWGADEALLRRMLSDGRHEFLIAETDGVLAGYGWYEFVLDEGYVGNLAVAEEHRRRGLGKALTRALLDDARDRGLVFLTLEVRESNLPARRLYEKAGFRTVGIRKNYYERPRENAVLMTVSLSREAEPIC